MIPAFIIVERAMQLGVRDNPVPVQQPGAVCELEGTGHVVVGTGVGCGCEIRGEGGEHGAAGFDAAGGGKSVREYLERGWR